MSTPKRSFINSLVFGISINKASELTGIKDFNELMSTLEDHVVETKHPDGSLESYSVVYKGFKGKKYYNISVVYRDEENDREVEVFTPKEYGKKDQYTGVEVTNLAGDRWIAEVGCWFENNRLIDYDGVYGLTPWVVKALRKAGWTVPRDME